MTEKEYDYEYVGAGDRNGACSFEPSKSASSYIGKVNKGCSEELLTTWIVGIIKIFLTRQKAAFSAGTRAFL